MFSLSRKLLSQVRSKALQITLTSESGAGKPPISQKLTQGFHQSEKVYSSNRVFNSKDYKRRIIIVERSKKGTEVINELLAGRAGQAAGAGSLLGLGVLCTTGPQIESKLGLISKQKPWPSELKQLINSTYYYFALSLITTIATAYKVARSPNVLYSLRKVGATGVIAALIALLGTSMVVHGSQYEPGNISQKHAASLLHSAILGVVAVPLCILGGPALIRTAAYTAGFCGGLCTLGICASSDEFFERNAPLAGSFGALFVASIGKTFLPPVSVGAGRNLYSMGMHVVLALFCWHMLNDSQRIVRKAKKSHKNQDSYDPVNQSSGMFMFNHLVLGSADWINKHTKS